MKVINQESDLHVHSLQFSDGLNTIDELVQMAGRLDLKKLAIADHSDARTSLPVIAYRVLLGRYANVLNDVEVVFGVEGDLLNDDGDICPTIQKRESEFLILSAHPDTFKGNPEKITDAYLKALERHHDKIQFICHPCAYFKHTDIERLTKAANEHGVPVEVNTSNLVSGRTDMAKLDVMVTLADQIVVNSDAHSLADMTTRARGLDYLRAKGFL
jgi:histidinol phosphatase-like PHP family hydrolase